MNAAPLYLAPRHPAPVDLDLSGTELAWREPSTLLPMGGVDRYPDRGPLTAALARRLGVDPLRLLVTAGSDEALERAFGLVLAPGREALLTRPTFEMLPRFARLAGAEVVEVPWSSGALPVAELLDRVSPRTALIAVVSPNNPTGSIATAEEIAELATGAPLALIVVDLAYVEFADHDPTSTLLTLPRVLVTRTFSKAWGLPGLRVGYAAGPVEVITGLRDRSLPYPVAGPSLVMAERALTEDGERMSAVVRNVREARGALATALTELGVPPLPSQGDFVCLDRPEASWIRDGLAGLGVGARWLGSSDPPRLRLTTPTTRADLDRLLEALRTVLRPEALLFDLDGVLADVSRSYREAIIGTAERFGVRVSGAEIQAFKRRGRANDDWALTTELLANAGRPVALAEVTTMFESLYQGSDDTGGLWQRERLIPDRRLLEKLAARFRLAIVTGRPRGDTERFLALNGIADLFATVVTRDDGPAKPDPFPVAEALRRLGRTRAWMIGDTPDDIRAARGAAVLPLGVVAPGDDPDATGSALLAAGAGRILTSLDELQELLP